MWRIRCLGKKRGRVSRCGRGGAGPDAGPQPEQEAAYPRRRLIRLPARDHASGASRARRSRVLHADDADGARGGLAAACEGGHRRLWRRCLDLLTAVGAARGEVRGGPCVRAEHDGRTQRVVG